MMIKFLSVASFFCSHLIESLKTLKLEQKSQKTVVGLSEMLYLCNAIRKVIAALDENLGANIIK